MDASSGPEHDRHARYQRRIVSYYIVWLTTFFQIRTSSMPFQFFSRFDIEERTTSLELLALTIDDLDFKFFLLTSVKHWWKTAKKRMGGSGFAAATKNWCRKSLCPRRSFSTHKKYLLYPDAKPNTAHTYLPIWEGPGKFKHVAQNIDSP